LASAIPARLSPREGRKFGLTVGAAFLTLATVLWWRERSGAPVFGTIGILLILAGVLIPSHLGPLQRAWMGLAHLISRVTTPVFMGVVYFGVLTPIALLRRAFGRNSLVARDHGGSYWVTRDPGDRARSDMERQF
jgi:hypothetical protein